ncbi:NDR1/HIN1-like protein 6 [Zingiber officinale]|uniref:Late embryogenesis abundant protein LEA-2 subgroup domain-containing protein n=1 Tax=Zingiber officinale TaxID=94328 RepID=A0A8J5FI33_ZINOF|nr:NDR1/HIN1-like protein 6 [Zingiber officinale]KAG6487195.1 hypothetical protein ZIOFF_055778 [Zingiber officinale]
MEDRVYPSSKPIPPPPQAANGGPPSFPPTKGQAYGTTLPTYRPQARKAPPPRRRRRGRCCSCCLWFTLILIVLVFLAAVAAGVFYLIYRPHRPVFDVSGLRLAAFNVSAAGQLTSRINLNVTARNPNRKLVYLYDTASVSVLSDGVDVGDGSFPAFVQDSKNTTLLSATLTSGQTLDATAASDLRKRTSLPLEINVSTKVGVKIGSLKTKKLGIRVRCSGVNVAVPTRKAAPATASTSNASCKVKLHLKIWKLTIS